MLKSREDKNINLSLSELKYAGADFDGITKYQLKKSILKYSLVPRNKTRRTTQEDVVRTYYMLLLKTKSASIVLLRKT